MVTALGGAAAVVAAIVLHTLGFNDLEIDASGAVTAEETKHV